MRFNDSDAVLAACNAVEPGSSWTEERPRPAGVLPDLLAPSEGPTISLGSRRLCTDPTKRIGHKRGEHLVIDTYDNPVIGCIEWRRVTFYKDRSANQPKKQEPRSTDGNLTRGSFNGYMSPATRRKVRKIVSTWMRSILLYRAEIKRRYDPGRAYPVMVTVTLPSDQVHRDAEITRSCFGPFIQALKRQHGIEHYFWRAESQENGRIHYHVLTDRYIRHEDLQVAWNKAVNKLGYVDRYREQSGKVEPPSTEVHAIREKVQDKKTGAWITVDPVEYLLDYLMDMPQPIEEEPSEKDQEPKPRKLIGRYRHKDGRIEEYTARPIDGRVWGMSDSLRSIREPRAQASVRLVTALEKARGEGKLRRVDNDHATMYFGDVSLVLGRDHPGMWQLIKSHYVNVFAHLYQDQLPKDYVRGRTFFDPADLWMDLQDFALYNRDPAELDVEEDQQAEEELMIWAWVNMDGQRVHRNLRTIFERWPLLKKYGTA